jgi:2-dehydropantoate 2-reductase
MKVAVVGCGAVGSFYGSNLARAGHEVWFLLRSDYDVVRRKGVLIRSPRGDFRVHPKAARAPQEIGASDLVVIGLKTTANDQFSRLLAALVGPATAVLTLQNGLGNEEQLARLFPAEQLLGGLCFVCLNRLEPGLIHHIDHGQIILGEFQRYPEPRTHELAAAFRHAGVPCSVTDNLARAHWEKLTWNIPFNGLGVAAAAGFDAVVSGEVLPGRSLGECLTTDRLLADGRWAKLVVELMREVAASARALGFQVPDAIADQQVQRTRTMGAYKASTLLDFERAQPLELNSLFLEPLRQAKQAGVPVPRLEGLCRVLQQLDPAVNCHKTGAER